MTITEKVRSVIVELIDPNPYQMRDSEDPAHIEQLANSIARDGLLQYPLARPGTRGDRVTLAFGHSRLAAYLLLKERAGRGEIVEGGDLTDLAKYNEMPVIVRDLTDEQLFICGAQENIARKNLTPVEEGKLMRLYREKFNKTSAEIGALFGLSESTVRNKMRLVDLPDVAITGLAEGKITENGARRLLSLQGILKPDVIAAVATSIIGSDAIKPEQVDGSLAYQVLQQKEAFKLYSSYEAKSGLAAELFPLDWMPAEPLPIPTAAQLKRFYLMEGQPANDHLTAPPECKKCPFFVSIANEGICGRKVCFERKRDAFVLAELARVSVETGIAILDPEKDGKVYEELTYNNGEEFGKMWESKSKDLRLVGKIEKWGSHRLTKSKCAMLVSISKKSITKAGKEKEERVDYAARERAEAADRENRQRNQELSNVFLEAVAPIFGEFLYSQHTLATLKVLCRAESWDNDSLKEATVEDTLEYLGQRFIRAITAWQLRAAGPVEFGKFLIGVVAEMGMPLTMDLEALALEISQREGAPA